MVTYGLETGDLDAVRPHSLYSYFHAVELLFVQPSLDCLGDVCSEAFGDDIRVLFPGSLTLGYRVELSMTSHM